MSKLIARVIGGLGNQLFIYAAAKALAMRTGAELVLDTQTGFRHDVYQRRFALQSFDIQYKEASAVERFDFPAGRGFRYVFRKANSYLPFQRRFYLVEKVGEKRGFMPELMSFRPAGRTWMEGYWQSPRYFEDIRETLQKELTVKSPISPETRKTAEQIQSSNSVCVHLRLVRHIVKGEETAADRNLELQHIVRNMNFIAQLVENPRFFCFADNPQAAESLRKLPYDIDFVTHNKGDERAHEDFYLMCLCRHFVLSNSTFCWWPAWLSNRPDSIVLSPPLHYWDNLDILPPHWMTADKLIPQVAGTME